MAKKKIGVLTGGGDAPGLNAVIYTLTKTCILKYDYELKMCIRDRLIPMKKQFL